jgi:lipoprotein-releasing system permease protein
MRRLRIRWPLVRLVAGRLILRDVPAGTGVRRLVGLSGAALVVSLAALVLGVESLWLVGVVGVSSMLLLAGVCLLMFTPAMAVSVVGIALSCASLTTALSVTSGFRAEITRAMARLNGHVLLTKYGLDFSEYEELSDRWRSDPRVTAVSPFAYSMVAVVPEPEDDADQDDGLGPAIVVGKGIDPRRAAELDGIADVMGRGDLEGLRPGDTRHRPGIVLGRSLAKHLDLEPGDLVRVVVPAELDGSGSALDGAPRFATFELTDLIDTGTSEFDRNLALMHLTAGQSLFFREGRVTGIEMELSDPALAEEMQADMEAELSSIYRVTTWRETNSALLIGLEQIRVTVSLVLGLMVVVAASSLIASLLLLVRRKRHDIAVLMAVGGDRGLMFWTFEAVGAFAGIGGAIMGLTLGALYCAVIAGYDYALGGDVYPVDHLPVALEAGDAFGPAFVAVMMCALASGPVAMLAARVGVIASLRQ